MLASGVIELLNPASATRIFPLLSLSASDPFRELIRSNVMTFSPSVLSRAGLPRTNWSQAKPLSKVSISRSVHGRSQLTKWSRASSGARSGSVAAGGQGPAGAGPAVGAARGVRGPPDGAVLPTPAVGRVAAGPAVEHVVAVLERVVRRTAVAAWRPNTCLGRVVPASL